MTSNLNVLWTPGMTLESTEKQIILAAIKYFRGNKTMTSQALGISIRTLEVRLEKYDKEDRSAETAILEQRAKELAQAEKNRQDAETKITTDMRNDRLSGNKSAVAEVHERMKRERAEREQRKIEKHAASIAAAAALVNGASGQGVSSKATGASASFQNGHDAEEGLHLEPASKTPTQHAMSVSVGAKVQSMSPKNTHSLNPAKRSR